MRCVIFVTLCGLLFGCGAMSYQNGDKRISIVKFGLDTTLESARYTAGSQTSTETIEITGMSETARIELLREAIDLAKGR